MCKRIARILILCLSVVLTPLTLGHAQETIDSVKIDRAHKILRDAYDSVRKNYYDPISGVVGFLSSWGPIATASITTMGQFRGHISAE